ALGVRAYRKRFDDRGGDRRCVHVVAGLQAVLQPRSERCAPPDVRQFPLSAGGADRLRARSDMSATFTPEEQLERSISTRKMLTWFIVFAIVMFFAGLTSAYLVSKSSGYWVHFDMPSAFHISTAAVVVSSIFAQMALGAAKNDRRKAIGPLLVITLALGIVFTWSQFKGWSQMVDQGLHVVGKLTDIKG